MHQNYLENIKKQFTYYRQLGLKTIEQLSEEELFWQYNEESNSVAIIIKHLWGNMLSRWTDFLTTDGEKESRKRDEEFENNRLSKDKLLEKWNEGWDCLFKALETLKVEDLEKIIYIRNQGHSVVEAINRQLTHYPYHIGQMIFIGKMLKGNQWENLSIPKGKSVEYNTGKFLKERKREHFTDET